jgi:hypothetical protein
MTRTGVSEVRDTTSDVHESQTEYREGYRWALSDFVSARMSLAAHPWYPSQAEQSLHADPLALSLHTEPCATLELNLEHTR